MIARQFKKLFPEYRVYPKSLREKDENYFFIARDSRKKYLVVYGEKGKKFERENLKENFRLCPLNHDNCEFLREIFPELCPAPSKLKTSFGFGDRIGLATPAHIRVAQKHQLFPVFAQQSIREITRTRRSMPEVMDSCLLGLLEAGYSGQWGADCDHIKDISHLKDGLKTGFSMFTIDISDYIKAPFEISSSIKEFFLNKQYSVAGKRYVFTASELKRIALSFAKGLNFAREGYFILKDSERDFDFEVSVDETESPTSALEHIFIVEYLRKNGVRLSSLALRFPGRFEKGIDYKGNIEEFEKTYREHYLISQFFGDYKLSLHSGSDKFSIYPIIQKISNTFHIKTAGTSWLQAIKTIALRNPSLYRKIHKCAIQNIEKDRSSYSISLNLNKILPIEKIADKKLGDLFSLPDARQLIHITYGSILNEFREKIYKALFLDEEEHYRLLEEHLDKHLNLLEI